MLIPQLIIKISLAELSIGKNDSFDGQYETARVLEAFAEKIRKEGIPEVLADIKDNKDGRTVGFAYLHC